MSAEERPLLAEVMSLERRLGMFLNMSPRDPALSRFIANWESDYERISERKDLDEYRTMRRLTELRDLFDEQRIRFEAQQDEDDPDN